MTITNFSIFPKNCPGIKTPKKHEVIILGSALGPKSQADLLGKKITELEKIYGIVDKLDAQYSFLCRKNASVCQELFYFLRTSICFNHPTLLEKYNKTVRDELSKVCNVDFDKISSAHLALPAEMGSLGVSSASSLELSTF